MHFKISFLVLNKAHLNSYIREIAEFVHTTEFCSFKFQSGIVSRHIVIEINICDSM